MPLLCLRQNISHEGAWPCASELAQLSVSSLDNVNGMRFSAVVKVDRALSWHRMSINNNIAIRLQNQMLEVRALLQHNLHDKRFNADYTLTSQTYRKCQNLQATLMHCLNKQDAQTENQNTKSSTRISDARQKTLKHVVVACCLIKRQACLLSVRRQLYICS